MTLLSIRHINGVVTADTSTFRDFLLPTLAVNEACDGRSGGYTVLGKHQLDSTATCSTHLLTSAKCRKDRTSNSSWRCMSHFPNSTYKFRSGVTARMLGTILETPLICALGVPYLAGDGEPI